MTVVVAVVTVIALLTTGCTIKWTQPEPIENAPTIAYEFGYSVMLAVKVEEPELVAPMCIASKDIVWPMLEGATAGTVKLRSDMIGIYANVARHYGAKETWIAIMGPALVFLNATIAPQVEFQDNWLDVLKAFTGGIMDACDGTDTHKPKE